MVEGRQTEVTYKAVGVIDFLSVEGLRETMMMGERGQI